MPVIRIRPGPGRGSKRTRYRWRINPTMCSIVSLMKLKGYGRRVLPLAPTAEGQERHQGISRNANLAEQSSGANNSGGR